MFVASNPVTMRDLPYQLGDRRLILVSNREPYEHVHGAHGIEVRRPPGGVVSALDPLMRRGRGVWVAWGSGSADRDTADERGRVAVPPEDPRYTLRRIWLSSDDVDCYYESFANSALWPLCHMLAHHFEPRTDAWERYREVNERFADAVAEEAGEKSRDVAWVQDYHLALVPAALRERRPGMFIHQFWHIPFPPPDFYRLMPGGMATALLRGLLGNDLLEFHTERYARNFLACVGELLPDLDVDMEGMRVRLGDRDVKVGAFPISIDVEHFEKLADDASAWTLGAKLRQRYASNGRQLAVSVDRVDYTKGIPQRLRALDLMWKRHPELRKCVTFLIVATPSRSGIPAYKKLEDDVAETVRGINARYRTPDWTPILLIAENVAADRLAAIYRAADLCLVSSLQDGMNLVAKEFIASQHDERGVLLLSRFTGAAEDIEGAMLVNPFNIDGLADGIRTALEMPQDERKARMRRMRADLRRATIFDWLDGVMNAASITQAARAAREARV
ncbi:MAG: trehalose-6-phosphate synthase [Gemmatimonadaceae bacterium]|nr:trehalose-6-phosphate synthase [Gemmatimonadaceae bacterium]